jgi:hypothetical protein
MLRSVAGFSKKLKKRRMVMPAMHTTPHHPFALSLSFSSHAITTSIVDRIFDPILPLHSLTLHQLITCVSIPLASCE